MTSGISGAGGPSGPGGIGGPEGPDGPDEVDGADAVGGGAAASGAARTAGAAGADPIDQLAADLDAGRITGDQALDRLVDQALPPDLAIGDRDELRAMMMDLVASDPHLAQLAARLGVAAPGGDDG